MSDIAVKVQNISKRYTIGTSSSGSLRESISGRFYKNKSQKTEDFWALNDVSFDVKKGEAIGIIGRNGAGKSTLLKILSRITEPTTGRIEIEGRVSSLLEVGTGFHMELTGRENVFLNGTILGMSRAEVKAKFDEIVAFSGVEKFLDTPVKRYSSGMKVRLAFAVAAHLEPEILIIDEVLAVGDAEFQKKCLGKMEDVASQGRTILFVSHNLAAVESLCSSAILLENGTKTKGGDIKGVIDDYLLKNQILNSDSDLLTFADKRPGSGKLRFSKVSILNNVGNPTNLIKSGEHFEISLCFKYFSEISNPNFILTIYSDREIPILNFSTENEHVTFSNIDSDGQIIIKVDGLNLNLGSYKINAAAYEGSFRSSEVLDKVESLGKFTVNGGDPLNTGKFPPTGFLVHKPEWIIKYD